jgi:hypothetical protein
MHCIFYAVYLVYVYIFAQYVPVYVSANNNDDDVHFTSDTFLFLNISIGVSYTVALY